MRHQCDRNATAMGSPAQRCLEAIGQMALPPASHIDEQRVFGLTCECVGPSDVHRLRRVAQRVRQEGLHVQIAHQIDNGMDSRFPIYRGNNSSVLTRRLRCPLVLQSHLRRSPAAVERDDGIVVLHIPVRREIVVRPNLRFRLPRSHCFGAQQCQMQIKQLDVAELLAQSCLTEGVQGVPAPELEAVAAE